MTVSNRAPSRPWPRSIDDAFARDVFSGLSRRPKSIPAKYFYDERGSRLFQQITEQDEYYLTRAEHEILQASCRQLAACFGDGPFRLVELGAATGARLKFCCGISSMPD